MSTKQYLSHDTIHALATPVGGALAIVRMSGPAAKKILSEITSSKSGEHPERETFRAHLKHGTATLDDAMAVYFNGPRSHTGEDVVELFLHGGSVVVQTVLEALTQKGSRQALPGEFSFRAVRNGKTTLAAAEAVADLIAAKNHGAAALAFEKMEGSQSKLVRDLAESLRKLTTLGELGIDFADQDVEELSLPVLRMHAAGVMEKLKALESSFDRGEKIQNGIKTAFVGRPNAGKSSFFNALLGEERSIVSEIAGTTRDVIRETITLQGKVTLRIEDTAGIRSGSNDPIEKIGIERSVRAAREADVILFVVAANETPEEAKESNDVWNELKQPADKAIAIITKTDVTPTVQIGATSERLAKLGAKKIFLVSSTEQTGVREAVSGIVDFCERFTGRDPGEVLLTRLDHLQAVRTTLTHLERATASTAEDLFAADLRQALNALGPVIGETLPDDILGRIFSEFCIGK